jgi:hypothetical protein
MEPNERVAKPLPDKRAMPTSSRWTPPNMAYLYGASQRIGRSHKSYRDTSQMNMAAFQRMGSGGIKPTPRGGIAPHIETVRSYRDKISLVPVNGVTIFDEITSSKFKLEFRDKHGVCFGGIRYTKMDVLSVATGKPIGDRIIATWPEFRLAPRRRVFIYPHTPVDIRRSIERAYRRYMRQN